MNKHTSPATQETYLAEVVVDVIDSEVVLRGGGGRGQSLSDFMVAIRCALSLA